MIVVGELSMTGNAHVEFNAAFLRVCAATPDSRITFFGEKKHVKAVVAKSKGYHPKIETYLFYLPSIVGNSYKRAMLIMLKEIICIFTLIKMLHFCRKNNVHTLYITSALPFTHWFLKKFLLKRNLHIKIMLVLHGELEHILYQPNVYYKLLLKALKITDLNFRYITLGDVCKKNVTAHFNLNPEGFIAIHHPYIYPELTNYSSDFKEKLLLATVGVHNAAFKNSHLIFEIAKTLTLTNISFKTIGKFEPDMLTYSFDNVDTSFSTSEMIPSGVFEQELAKVNYILMFYPSNAYRFMASGVFFDAIKLGKPIIAIRNSFFEYYFNLLGNIGFLVDDLVGMKEIIKRLDNGEINCYQEQLDNLKNARETLSIQKIREQLANQIN